MERHFGECKQQIFFFVCEHSEKDFSAWIFAKVQNKLISLHKNMKNPKYLFDSMGRNVSRGAFPAEWLDEAIWVDFENAKLPIPKEYDKYLKYLYGGLYGNDSCKRKTCKSRYQAN